MTGRGLATAIAVGLAGCGPAAQHQAPGPATAPAPIPASAPAPTAAADGFAGVARCAACHTDVHQRWLGSMHSRSLRPASRATIHADFGPTHGAGDGLAGFRAIEKPDGLYVNAMGPDGELADFKVDYAIGDRRIHMLIHRFPDGRLQVLPSFVEIPVRRWFPYWEFFFDIGSKGPIWPENHRFWTNPGRGFNASVYADMCIDCHTSQPARNFDPATNRYDTRWVDPNVNCEACHGPGAAHAARWEAIGKGTQPAEKRRDFADLAALPPERSTEVCAQCHASKQKLAEGYRPGADWFAHYAPVLLDDGVHVHPDGKDRELNYNYLALEQSRCAREGRISCLGCHAAHGSGNPVDLKVAGEPDRLCTSCHRRQQADLTAHTHHKAGSPGSRCVECHMPWLTIENGHGRMRDHTISIPVPANTERHGVPNACNTCHQDQTAAWSREWMGRWWGAKSYRAEAIADAVAGGRSAAAGEPAPAGTREALLRLLTNPNENWIYRASAARLLAPFADPEVRGALEIALAPGQQPVLRSSALYGLLGHQLRVPDETLLARLRAALDDPERAVRQNAAFGAVVLRDPERIGRARELLGEIVDMLGDNVDHRSALAEACAIAGEFDAAWEHYAICLRIFPLSRSVMLGAARLALGQIPRARDAGDAARTAKWAARAREATERYVPAYPDDAEARLVRGQARLESGDAHGALVEAEAALALLPGWPPAEELRNAAGGRGPTPVGANVIPDAVAPERDALLTALAAAGLTPNDLRFRKENFPAEAILPVVRGALADPLATVGFADAVRGALAAHAADGHGLPGLAGLMGTVAAREIPPPEPGVAPTPLPAGVATLPPALAAAMRLHWPALDAAARALAQALAPLSPGERALVRAWGLRHVLAPDEAFEFFVPLPLPAGDARAAAEACAGRKPKDAVLAALAKVDVAWLEAAMRRLTTAARAWAEAMREVPVEAWAGVLRADPAGRIEAPIVLRAATPFGDLVIGGPGANTYADPQAALILDPGGDDVYRGAGLAGVDASGTRRLSVIVDAAGHDAYAATDDFALGGACLGLALLVDDRGDDTYHGRVVTQGAAVGGYGLLLDGGGRDDYLAERHAQGAALGGLGLCWDRGAGGDTYQAASFAQGFARTNGGALLLDEGGGDTYVAGGVYPYLPQAPEHHYSHAQGYGLGVRESGFAGGVGVCCDLAGDDRYVVEMHGQGASCWYGLGMLLDRSGNDQYRAVFNAQGAAVHLSAGLLLDEAGNDRYTLAGKNDREGLGQGAAHDWAVGILADRAGNDVYRARAGAQGVGFTTGLGILLERAGDDRYEGETGHLQGAGRRDRELPSLGILVDLAGADRYSTDRHDGAVWVPSDLGIGCDASPLPAAEPSVATTASPHSGDAPVAGETLPVPAADVVLTPDAFEALFTAASEWNVGAARPRVRRARDELIAWGPRVLPHLGRKLAEWNGPVMWAVDDVLSGVAVTDRPAIVAFLRAALVGEDPTARVVAMLMCGKLGVSEAAPQVLAGLVTPGVQRFAATAAGHLRLFEAVPALVAMAGAADETEAAGALRALGAIAHADALPTLLAALRHPSFLVRDAAARACAAMGGAAADALLARATDETASAVERVAALAACRWLPDLMRPSFVDRLTPLLNGPPSPIRAAAVETLAECGASASAPLRERLEREANPTARRRMREAESRLGGKRAARAAEELYSGLVEYPDFFGGG